MESVLPNGYWKETYSRHLLGLGRFLEKKRQILRGENFVYLAGMVARWLDKDYKEDTEGFLVENPSEIDLVVRRHAPYIGQNAPVVTVSKLNAEFCTITIAQKEKSIFRQFELKTPGKFFSIASTYSFYSGNRTHGEIFGFFAQQIHKIAEILGDYLDSLEGELPSESPITDGLWNEFGKFQNPRNTKKEQNEKRNITEKEIEKDAIVHIREIVTSFRGNN
jgi:hypothetical protein